MYYRIITMKKMFAMTTSHCTEGESDHQDETESDHHNEGHDHDADFCQLNVYYLATFWKDPEGKSKFFSLKKNNPQIAVNFDNTSCIISSSCFQLKIFSICKPVLEPKYLTRALRAPPYC